MTTRSIFCVLAALPVRLASRTLAVVVLLVGLAGMGFTGVVVAQPLAMSANAVSQIQALIAEKETRTPAQRKIDSQLLYAGRMARGLEAAPGVATLETDVEVDSKGMVEVDIRGDVNSKTEALVALAGGYVVRSFGFADSIEAVVPIANLEMIAQSEAVRFIAPKARGMVQRASSTPGASNAVDATMLTPRLQRFKTTVTAAVAAAADRQNAVAAASEARARKNWPGDVILNVGSVTSQGDVTHRASDVRSTFGFNGAGTCVGVISDSFNNLGAAATDVSLGDLPGVGTPFPYSNPVGLAGSGDLSSGGSDEGRAMIQIVHDLVPGARIYFATAFNSLPDFANNIRALRGIAAAPGPFGNVTPKCDIIVDDIFYFVETGLHDGQPAPSNANIALIVQAVNDVVADGALYFSSAGNSGGITQGTAGAWEGDFVSGTLPAIIPGTGDALVWSGTDVGNTIVATGSSITMHWSDPVGASTNDYDLFRLNSTLTSVVASSTNLQTGTQDPVELVSTGTNTRLVVVRRTGAAPRFISLSTNRGRLQYATVGQTRGHSAAATGFGVAATPAATTFGAPTPNGPFPGPFVVTNQIERFSSDGPRRSFFNADGTAVTPGNFLAGTGGGIVRQKPDFTAADGVGTTLPGASGLNPFYGTSAAAPHAAAIAALLKQAVPLATKAQIASFLTTNALDIMVAGADRDSGAGILQAFQAVSATGATPQAVVQPLSVAVNFSGGNAVLDPNECNTLALPLINVGPVGATAVSMTLSTTTPGVEITKAVSAYPNLAANGGNSASTSPFEVTTSRKLACLATASFTQTVNFTGGTSPRVYSFSLPIGTPAQYGFVVGSGAAFPGGAAGPIAGSAADDAMVSVAVPAGFSFNVYGTTIAGGATLRASTNGNLQFVAAGGNTAFSNTMLPAGGFGAVPTVFPFFDDLLLTTTGGGIYTNLVGVAPNRQFIVEWRGKHFNDAGTTNTLNFGVVFNEGSSVVEYRYPQVASTTSSNGGSATVGVQNGAVASQFTQYSFNQPLITTGLVLTGTLAGGCSVGPGQCTTPLFADVPNGYWAAQHINSIYNNIPRITQGCATGPLRYCPTTDVSREAMAAFIIRAVEGEPSPTLCSGGSPFTDVPAASPFCPYIKRMQALGITNGCAVGLYCPTQTVNRESMAVFLVRAIEGEPSPTLCSGGSPFTDVSQASPFCPHIKRLQALGVTQGCAAGLYCPAAIVQRDSMAVFLGRAFLGM